LEGLIFKNWALFGGTYGLGLGDMSHRDKGTKPPHAAAAMHVPGRSGSRTGLREHRHSVASPSDCRSGAALTATPRGVYGSADLPLAEPGPADGSSDLIEGITLHGLDGRRTNGD
jgi:hypothetical protein